MTRAEYIIRMQTESKKELAQLSLSPTRTPTPTHTHTHTDRHTHCDMSHVTRHYKNEEQGFILICTAVIPSLGARASDGVIDSRVQCRTLTDTAMAHGPWL